MEKAPRKQRSDDQLEEIAARAVRRVCSRWWGKKPVVKTLISRLEEE